MYRLSIVMFLSLTSVAGAQARYTGADGRLRVALAQQPFSPNGTSRGPATMASGGIRDTLARLNAVVRSAEAALTAEQSSEYGGWKRLGMALGDFADLVRKNEADGYFTVGLLATCPSMPGLVAGLQKSGSGRDPLRIGMLWLDAHPDINTRKPPAAVPSAACRWPSPRDAHCNACASTPDSNRRCRTSMS